MVAEQGIKFLIEVINSGKALSRLFGIVALGYIAGYSNKKAMNIIEMKVCCSLTIKIQINLINQMYLRVYIVCQEY